MSSITTRTDRAGAAPIAAYLVLCVVWGSTFLGIRVAVETIPPWTMIGTRSLIAGIVLTGFALARGATVPTWRGWMLAAITGGLMFAICQSLLAWGELRLPSGEAAILGCTVSLFTPLVSWLMGASQRPGLAAGAGLVVGFAGVVVLAGGLSASADLTACVAVFSTAIFWAFGAATTRRWPPAPSALLTSGMQLVAGGLLGLPIGALRGEWTQLAEISISTRSVLALAYLIVMGSLVAFACFGWLVQVWRPERVSTYAYINPIVALFIGAWLGGERIGVRELVAVAMILGAVALVMLGNRRWLKPA